MCRMRKIHSESFNIYLYLITATPLLSVTILTFIKKICWRKILITLRVL